MYVSTNPWKITATFQTVSSSKEEYLALIEQLKAEVPSGSTQKRNKMEQNQLNLIKSLEDRVEVIDAELAVSLNSVYIFLSVTDRVVAACRPDKEENRTTTGSLCSG